MRQHMNGNGLRLTVMHCNLHQDIVHFIFSLLNIAIKITVLLKYDLCGLFYFSTQIPCSQTLRHQNLFNPFLRKVLLQNH